MSQSRLLAIDPSLTCSGWALFGLQHASLAKPRLVGIGKIKGAEASLPLALRLARLQSDVVALFSSLRMAKGDYLVCEAPTTMRDPRAAIKVEQVRSIFECSARNLGVSVPGRINPRTVQYEIMGLKGKQLPRDTIKDCALQTALTLFRGELEGLGFPLEAKQLKQQQDIIDALLVGKVATQRILQASQQGVSIEELLDKDREKRISVSRLKLRQTGLSIIK